MHRASVSSGQFRLVLHITGVPEEENRGEPQKTFEVKQPAVFQFGENINSQIQ